MKTVGVSLLLFLFCYCGSTQGQNRYTVNGIVIDTAGKSKIHNASIIILNAKDSILNNFTWSGSNGSFKIENLTKGDYLLIVSYPGYVEYIEKFRLDSANKIYDFGEINIVLQSILLKGVIVKGAARAIKINGDTTEFNARAYVIQPNDKVEDLLKQFPGIQVDRNGNITARGKLITKVLLDGEEFFGDDPTLVTKNIRADMVDKVLLYEKKSDQATFTGIDDGVRTETLNITLKKDKNTGSFGKVELGAGNNYYQERGMYNSFTSKNKFSAYLSIANTGLTGLSNQENQKYTNGGSDLGLTYDNQGIPSVKTGGVHYDTKWGNGKYTLNTNYRIGSLEVNGLNNTITQNNLPTAAINSTSDQFFNNYGRRQKLDLIYQAKLDTVSNLKVTVDGSLRNIENTSNFAQTSTGANSILLNNDTRNLSNSGQQQIFNISGLYTRKLKKKGRTLSLLLTEAVNNNDNNGLLKSELNFYDNTAKLISHEVIDQSKPGSNQTIIFNSNLTYTEPINKSLAMVFNYGLNHNQANSNQETYNRSTTGNYDLIDVTLSNDYKLSQLSNQTGLILNYKKGKSIFNFGTRVTYVNQNQRDLFTGNTFERNFLNWYPQATYKHEFSSQKSVEIYYDGNTTQPTVNQLQPLTTNTDPLNIFVGNQRLTLSFTNRLNASYNSYKVLNNQFFNLSGTFSLSTNQIINTINVDSGARSTYSFTNISNRLPYNYSFFGSFNQKFTGSNLTAGITLNSNGIVNYSVVNGAITTSNSSVYQSALTLNKYVEKKYSFNLSAGPLYNVNESSSVDHKVNSNGYGFSGRGSIDLFLPSKFKLSSDLISTYTASTVLFNQSLKRTLWNVIIYKAFLKDQSLNLSLTVNDLLNQNSGLVRVANGNIVTQTDYNTIRRYFLFSITWDFNEVGKSSTK